MLVAIETVNYRVARASVVINVDGVLIRNMFRSVEVSWRDIKEFRLVPGFAGLVLLKDGAKIRAQGLAVIRIGRSSAITRN